MIRSTRALAGFDSTSDPRSGFGRTLVLGAGACRLAYDLCLHAGATRTAVVDIDPFLLVIAEAVVRGAHVTLTETSVNAPEIDPVSRRWTLAAPGGPLTEDAFQFFLADGTTPPFADESFDTHRDPLVHRPGPDRSRRDCCVPCMPCSRREVVGSIRDR